MELMGIFVRAAVMEVKGHPGICSFTYWRIWLPKFFRGSNELCRGHPQPQNGVEAKKVTSSFLLKQEVMFKCFQQAL